jgi:hypothetical protein
MLRVKKVYKYRAYYESQGFAAMDWEPIAMESEPFTPCGIVFMLRRWAATDSQSSSPMSNKLGRCLSNNMDYLYCTR